MPGTDREAPGAGSLRARQKQLTRQLLLDAAVQVIVDLGYASATVEDIAQAAGASRQTFYQYFPSKADVVLELVERKQAEVDELFGALFALEEPTASELRAWIRRAIEIWYPASPERVVVQQVMALEPAVDSRGGDYMVASLDALAGYLRRQNPMLGQLSARVRACRLIAEFEMLSYLRLYGIPGGIDLVVDGFVRGWRAALTEPEETTGGAPPEA
ncbi:MULTISPECIES: TetR/AcrR family transcriptional regulator [unclassified Pseudofrankia]|uniref:TetR/AcrR family transcriptional regulator n=1 Tax=unclassified Pseudofrankia TaxID=2994372 RepID=UPI0008D9C829|nr:MULTISPECIES: TetR/AcrR family transcriptional regulator [unclassified Pseudofrankia]MDT3439992.1 TetR/AcrR family transcriptional regulator [Pseudofrankia sp. BMG5.37]OHV48447.1 hypothetical protein BCD48_15870 [Pseudofrankia sp. BMG5.36]